MKIDDRGQTIIEAVVALGAIFIIVAAITIAIVNAVNNSQFIKSQNLANKYGQQGMEFVRNVQSEDITAFAQYSGAYSYPEDATALVPGAPQTVNIGTTHIRSIMFSDNEEPCLNDDGSSLSLKKITVTVTWSSGKCPSDDRFCHNSTVVSCIPYEGNPNVIP